VPADLSVEIPSLEDALLGLLAADEIAASEIAPPSNHHEYLIGARQ
jgi:hypothetical protein